MNKLFYPALFHKAEEGGFWVTFPDLPECMTQGDNMEEAYSTVKGEPAKKYNMAVDALGLCLIDMDKEHIPFPAASSPDRIPTEPDAFLAVIEFDMLAYKKRTSSAAVKKTLSIPEWLNEEALSLNVNFSQVLQDALIELVQSQKA